MKKKISAEIVADSMSPQGHRITTMLLTFPRFILPELNTHRMFSKNSASSRAIPFEKMVKMVEENPFIPIAWQKDHKGMQGTEYFTDEEVRVDVGDEFEYREDIRLVTDNLKARWFKARDKAINAASEINDLGLTKQLCNRLLEPFMWHTVLVTATEYDNFFELRCPKYEYLGEQFRSRKDALNSYTFEVGFEKERLHLTSLTELDWIKLSKSGAEIHIQALAEAMWDAMNESTPRQLEAGMWHYPFHENMPFKVSWEDAIKISVARAARLSYMTFDGEIDYEKDIQLHNKLLADGHMSPFEHCARAMSDLEYFSFIKGRYPSLEDSTGIINYERYPKVRAEMQHIMGFKGINPKNPDIYGWCNNFRGFIPYRYLVEVHN